MDELTFVGHATVRLRLDGTTVLTDPVMRSWIGPLRRHAAPPAGGSTGTVDVALVSHLHHDHLHLRSLRRLPVGTPLLVPRGAGEIASRAGAGEIFELAPGEKTSMGDLTFTAVPAVHDSRRFPLGRVRAEPIGYVIESRHRRVYFAGDTDLFSGMSELRPLDLALLPIWGWGPKLGSGHLDPVRAARALELLQPSLAVPIHWGTFYPAGLRRLRPRPLVEPPEAFAREARAVAPDVAVRVLRPGESLQLHSAIPSPAG